MGLDEPSAAKSHPIARLSTGPRASVEVQTGIALSAGDRLPCKIHRAVLYDRSLVCFSIQLGGV